MVLAMEEVFVAMLMNLTFGFEFLAVIGGEREGFMSVKTYGQIFQVLRGFIELGFKWVQTSSPMRANLKVQTRVPRRLYINPCSPSSLSQRFISCNSKGG
jgi:hypothetical protein